MEYTKPEITRIDDASVAIQGMGKPNGLVDSIPHRPLPSATAYESDE